MICETKRIRSHYLLVDRKKSLPNLAASLRKGAGPLHPIDATMQLCRPDYPAPRDWLAALTLADPGLQGFSTACWGHQFSRCFSPAHRLYLMIPLSVKIFRRFSTRR